MIAKLKLKLNRESVAEPEPAPGNLRFPARAVRALPAPQRWTGRPSSTRNNGVHNHDQAALRHPELVRQIEATLDRMQSDLDQLKEQVENYRFPGARDEDRPKAA